MASAWKSNKPSPPYPPKYLLFLLTPLSLLLLFLLSPSPNTNSKTLTLNFPPFDCNSSPQATPVIASIAENLTHPFLFSLSDFGSLPDKPHKNIQRVLKGKPFRRPDISATIQDFLEGKGKKDGMVVDVGANVGMASFAAAAMGFRVVAFEPVFENLQRICDGVFLNRVWDRVTVFAAAASIGSERSHSIRLLLAWVAYGGREGYTKELAELLSPQLVGRLDNSAISATGAKLAFKSNKEIAVEVATIPLDEVIPDTERVLLIKIDVQGWEYHMLRGASKLLSRKTGEAPYLIYEEDERLLKASNSSAKEIRRFLRTVGYHHCTMHGADAHCTKDS